LRMDVGRFAAGAPYSAEDPALVLWGTPDAAGIAAAHL
jgi:hypothetical protein